MRQVGIWVVEGIGEDFVPSNCDLSLVKKAYAISDKESFLAARELLEQEGILAGSSSGTLLAAALQYCREQTTPKRVVCWSAIPAPSISPRCSTTYWRRKARPIPSATARCAIWSSALQRGTAIVVRPDDAATVFARMRSSDVSQLPVMDGDRHRRPRRRKRRAGRCSRSGRRRQGIRAAGQGRHGHASWRHFGRGADRAIWCRCSARTMWRSSWTATRFLGLVTRHRPDQLLPDAP